VPELLIAEIAIDLLCERTTLIERCSSASLLDFG